MLTAKLTGKSTTIFYAVKFGFTLTFMANRLVPIA